MAEPHNIINNLGGSYIGWSHWKEVSYPNSKGGIPYTVHVDTSAKKSVDGVTVHPVYLKKQHNCTETFFIAFFSLAGSPFFIAIAIIYHLARFALIPVALLGAAIKGALCKKGSCKEKAVAFWNVIKQVPAEMAVSLRVVVTTPLLGGAWSLCQLFILINPSLYIYGDCLNVRKAAGAIEYIWNRSISVFDAYGIVKGAMTNNVKPRWGAAPEYVQACFQAAGYYDPKTHNVVIFGFRVEDKHTYIADKSYPWQPCCRTPQITKL